MTNTTSTFIKAGMEPECAVDGDSRSSSPLPDGEYEVESILSQKVERFKYRNKEKERIKYLVSWKGYGPEANEWIDEKDAGNAQELIREYWKNNDKVDVSNDTVEVEPIPNLTTFKENIEESLDSSVPDGEYEIEAILKHRIRRNKLKYLVSWKGYTSEHDLWISEENAKNAKVLIREYWADRKIGNRKPTSIKSRLQDIINNSSSTLDSNATSSDTPNLTRLCCSMKSSSLGEDNGSKSSMKRSRDGTGSASQVIKRRRVRNVIRCDSASNEERTPSKSEKLNDLAKKTHRALPLANAEWEHVVERTDALHQLADGRLVFTLQFISGKSYHYEAAVANHRCPQKVITFYESLLHSKPQSVQVSMLREIISGGSQEDALPTTSR